ARAQLDPRRLETEGDTVRDETSSCEPEPAALGGLVDRACDRFEADWKARRRPRIEEDLDGAPEPARPALFREPVMLELDLRRGQGERPMPQEYRARFPGYGAIIDAVLEPTPLADPGPRDGASGQPDTEHDLLFGILAVQMGFLSLQAFAEGMRARAPDEARTLGQILAGQGALSDPQ